jgi:Flp pilus assembly protein TadG
MKIKRQIGQSGQAFVEFALVAILFFLILLGIFDLGRVVFYNSNLTNAAREGARYGAVHPDDIAGITAAVCQLSAGIGIGCPTPTTTVCGLSLDTPVACPDPQTTTLTIAKEPHAVLDDDYIEVHLIYTFTPVTPLIAMFLDGGQISLNVQTTMRIEG